MNGTLTGTDHISNIETLIGSAFADTLDGDAESNVLDGAGGNDTLNGHGGNDDVSGGAGDDTIAQEVMADFSTLEGGAGVDTLTFAALDGSIDLDLEYGDVAKYHGEILIGVDVVGGFEQVFGTAHDDEFAGSALAETLNGNAGNDTIAGGQGNDKLMGDAGNDSVLGEAGNDYLDGGAGNDDLDGGEGNDMLYGQDGADTLNGGAGSDNLRGGAGKYLLLQDILNDSNNFDGGTDDDTLDYSAVEAAGGTIAANLANRTVTKTINRIVVGTDTLGNIESLVATRYADTLLGSVSADRLYGGAGDDTVSGGGGYDYLYGGAGDDTVKGGAGDAHLYGDAGNDRLVGTIGAGTASIDGGDGFDTMDYSSNTGVGMGISASLLDGVVLKFNQGDLSGRDYISDIEAITGTPYDDILLGGDREDVLNGAAGNDSIMGGGGADCIAQEVFNGNDTIDGGAGVDTLDYGVVKVAGARVVADLQAGSVMKYHGGTAVGTDTVRNIELFIGTANNDTMRGSDQNDYLDGAAGNDSLDGGNFGQDTLMGGAGNDTLSGGPYNDSVSGGDGDDRIVQTSLFGSASLDGGPGIDTLDYSQAVNNGINGSVSVNLADGMVDKGYPLFFDRVRGVEIVIGTAKNDKLVGGENNDDLRGDAGNDTLNGAGGNDKLSGNAGNDTFISTDPGGSDTLDGGADWDTLDYRQLTGTGNHIVANLSAGTITKYRNGVAAGVDKFSNIEAIIGTNIKDTLLGGDHSDNLNGAGGDDSITAGAGNDTIVQDVLTGDDTLDGGAGIDNADYSRAAGAGVKVYVQLSTGTVVKWLADVIVGQDQLRNIEEITGTDANDSMTGSAGNDIFNGQRGNDNLSGGNGHDNLYGGYGADTLNGGYGADALDGGRDADVLNGGDGDDTVNGSDGDDRIVQEDGIRFDSFIGGSGIDTLDYSGLSAATETTSTVIDLAKGYASKYTGTPWMPVDYFSGIENVIGSAVQDTITAGDQSSQLDGAGGDDIVRGGASADTLKGGAGNDWVYGNGGGDMIVQDGFLDDDYIDGGAGVDTVDYRSLTEPGSAIQVGRWDQVGRMSNGTTYASDTLRDVERVIGTRYNDQMSIYGDLVWIDGDDGDDVIRGASGNDSLAGGSGNDTIASFWSGGNDTLDGGSGRDTLDYSNVDLVSILFNQIGVSIWLDLLEGIATKSVGMATIGVDTIRNFETVHGTGSDDRLYAHPDGSYLNGRKGADSLNGREGNDTLYGDNGRDVIAGNGGSDRLVGGAGDDYVIGGDGNDTMSQDSWEGNDSLDGGPGNDLLEYSAIDIPSASISVDLNAGTVRKLQDGLVIGTDWILNVDSLIGTQGGDTIIAGGSRIWIDGAGGNDSISSGSGNDYLSGGAGDDLLLFGTMGGNDTLDGGSGFDTADYSAFTVTGGSIAVDLAAGTVIRYQYGTAVGADTLISIERVIGTSGNDVMTSSGSFVRLDGGDGNDSMASGAGYDSINAGAGDDRITLAQWGGLDTLDGGPGTDILDYSTADLAGSGVKVDLTQKTVTIISGGIAGTDSISNFETIIGTASNDTMTGSAGSVLFNGMDGVDSLTGGDGNDTLLGGDAGDWVHGGDGDDELHGGAGDDGLNGAAGNDMLYGGDGDDNISGGSATFGPEQWVGNDTLEGGAGFDTADYSAFARSVAGAGFVFDAASGMVTKYLNGTVIGFDKLVSIELVIGGEPALKKAAALPAEAFITDGNIAAEPVTVTLTGAPPLSMSDLLGVG